MESRNRKSQSHSVTMTHVGSGSRVPAHQETPRFVRPRQSEIAGGAHTSVSQITRFDATDSFADGHAPHIVDFADRGDSKNQRINETSVYVARRFSPAREFSAVQSSLTTQ